jgi:hypothetical protein
MGYHHENSNSGFHFQRFDDRSDGNPQAQMYGRKEDVTDNQRNDVMSDNLAG